MWRIWFGVLGCFSWDVMKHAPCKFAMYANVPWPSQCKNDSDWQHTKHTKQVHYDLVNYTTMHPTLIQFKEHPTLIQFKEPRDVYSKQDNIIWYNIHWLPGMAEAKLPCFESSPAWVDRKVGCIHRMESEGENYLPRVCLPQAAASLDFSSNLWQAWGRTHPK